jgi:predicted enzyme related to lactoylglutathione lyase
MTNPFVWFHNGSEKPAEVAKFYEELLGWKGSEGPAGIRVFSGERGPFAGVAPKDAASQGWIPYAQVEDVDRATERAATLGAKVLQKRTRGPAGVHDREGSGRGDDRALAEVDLIEVSRNPKVRINPAIFCQVCE